MPRGQPGWPKVWNDYNGTMPKVLRGLVADGREVRGLEAADPWARQPPSKWPEWYMATRCAACTYPGVGKARPFGIPIVPSSKLGRKPSEEEPFHLHMDVEKWEAWRIDPQTGETLEVTRGRRVATCSRSCAGTREGRCWRIQKV